MNKSRLKSTVLVIDDDADFAELIKTCLEANGFIVVACSNTDDGFKELNRNPAIELILSDVAMPAESGTGFLTKVRKSHGRLPFILMSGHLEFENGAARVLGADAALSKPFTNEALLETVKSALESQITSGALALVARAK